MSDREKQVAKANEKALSEAARRLLADLNTEARGEAQRPQLIDAFLSKVGGIKGFGELIGHDLQRVRGFDPNTGLEDPNGMYKPAIAAKLTEIMSRLISQQDDKESIDPASLNDVDLQAVLQGLMVDTARNNPAFCEAVVSVIMQENPRVIHEAVNPKPLEAESVKRIDVEDGLDESEAVVDE